MKRFFDLVEIRTKIASVLPFLLGLAYVAYLRGSLRWKETLLFFVSMLFFDMSTTTINNIIDSKKGPTVLPFRRGTSKGILAVLLAVATAAGLWLAWITGPVVLLAGTLCFAVGILYTFGPVPLSRMPLGEVFSGVFMGLFIPFLTVFVNSVPGSLILLDGGGGWISLQVNAIGIARLILLTVPPMMVIAGIMLANNICDLEADRLANRFTLPHYLGIRNAVRLFAGLYIASYVAIIAMAAFNVLPAYILLALLTAIPVGKNVLAFHKKQSKAETFPLSVQNMVLLVVPMILIAGLAAVI